MYKLKNVQCTKCNVHTCTCMHTCMFCTILHVQCTKSNVINVHVHAIGLLLHWIGTLCNFCCKCVGLPHSKLVRHLANISLATISTSTYIVTKPCSEVQCSICYISHPMGLHSTCCRFCMMASCCTDFCCQWPLSLRVCSSDLSASFDLSMDARIPANSLLSSAICALWRPCSA